LRSADESANIFTRRALLCTLFFYLLLPLLLLLLMMMMLGMITKMMAPISINGLCCHRSSEARIQNKYIQLL